jgi:D-alanine-D-alanine ligase
MRVAFLYNDSSEDPAGLAEGCLPEQSPIVLALQRAGHKVTPIACTLDLAAVRRRLDRVKPEVVFNRVESLGGSDALASALALLLDTLRLPYTGGPTAALLATSSKIAVKERLVEAGLPTPGWIECSGEQGAGSREKSIAPCSVLPAPSYILKSVLEHASFAMDDDSIVTAVDREHVIERICECESRYQRPYFAEQYIDGREFNLAVMGDEPKVLPPAEIDFSAFPAGKPRIVGQGAKFDEGSFEFENTPRRYDFPAADGPLVRRLTELTVECWQLFALRGYARVDFRVDAENRPWILEINSNPCLAPGSGFAAAADEAGIDYDQLIGRILLDAVVRDRRGPNFYCEPKDEHALTR